MPVVTIAVDSGEMLGLSALAELDGAAQGTSTAPADVVARLVHTALRDRLHEAGLPWAPSGEAVRERAAQAARPAGPARALWQRDRVRRYAVSLLAVAALVLLCGGYLGGWQWTGFQANEQVWDWLRLLLLPLAVGTIPLWINRSGDLSPAARRAGLAAAAVFGVFVLAGYVVPLGWTGFAGNTLWNWFELLLLPAAIVIVPLLPRLARSMRPRHMGLVTLLGVGWLVSIVGGYTLRWSWTGYQGNTLWDWLQLLLLPLIVPTVLVPVAGRWVSHGRVEPAAAGYRPNNHELSRSRR